MKTPDYILTSDWHLREDQPVSRVDDFWEAQWSKVRQISDLQEEYGCPVLHGGDLYHHWKPSPNLLSKTLQELPLSFYTIYGQHDLPNHNWELRYKSGIYNLEASEALHVLPEASWGQEPNKQSLLIGERKVLVWHKFVWDGKKVPWPDCDEMTAIEVLKKYPEYDLIVTGDHHKPFIKEYKGRLLVNPGCLTRQAADYANHKPRVYLWYAKDNSVKVHYLDVSKDVVSREHLEKKEKRDARIEAFIERLSDDWESVTSFEENLDRFFGSNRVRKSVKKLIYESIE